jgi:hypothetical protein
MGAVPVFVGGPDTLGPGLVPLAGYPALTVERHRVRSLGGTSVAATEVRSLVALG